MFEHQALVMLNKCLHPTLPSEILLSVALEHNLLSEGRTVSDFLRLGQQESHFVYYIFQL